MTPASRATLTLTLALLCAAAAADEPSLLPKDEVKATITGKTAVYNAANGSPQRAFYSADGTFIGRIPNTAGNYQSRGTWEIEDDGMICQKIVQGPMSSRCYYLVRRDGALGLGNKERSLPVQLE